MKYWFRSFAYFLVICLAACTHPTPSASIEPTATPPPATAIPTETSTPDPTETPVPPSPSPTVEQEPFPTHPGPRAVPDMVFHEGLEMVLMLNGSAENNHLWGWDGNTWRIVGDSGPDVRALGGMVYDPQRDKVVVYGGFSLDTNRCQFDTWEWDGQTWHQFEVPSPDVCSHFVMEYDATLGKTLLFSGADEFQNPSTGMWTWDGEQWETLAIEPPEARFHTMNATDPASNRVFLLGGFDEDYRIFDEFWVWDGAWEQLTFPRPPALSHARMAFDSSRGELVMFGGTTRARIPFDMRAETWVLTGDVWEQRDGPAPSPRGGQGMAYDPVRDRIVLYGGFDENDQAFADTWEWRGLGWVCVDACEPDQTNLPSDVILFRGDTRRAGVYNSPAIRTQPEQVWSASTDLAYLENLLLHEGVLYTGGASGKLYAFDALTGEELWQGGDFQTAVSAVAISGDVIVVGGYNRLIQALDRENGEVLWEVDAEGRTLAQPLILEDRVYMPATNIFYALNLETGEVLWTAPLPSTNDFDFVSGPAYENGRLVMSVGKSFLALDSETGELLWQIEKDTYFYFVALGQTMAYVGNEDGFFYAYDLETGEEVWTFEGGSEVWFGPAVTEETVYVGHFNGFMYALDAQTGEKRWEFEAPSWAVSDAVLSDGVLYFTDCNHEIPWQECHLYAVEAETGTLIWEYAAEGTLFGTPVLGEGVIYLVLSSDVLALR